MKCTEDTMEFSQEATSTSNYPCLQLYSLYRPTSPLHMAGAGRSQAVPAGRFASLKTFEVSRVEVLGAIRRGNSGTVPAAT